MPKICSHKGCNTPVFSKGFCQTHWRWWKASQPTLAQTDSKVAKPFRVIKKVSDKQAKLNAIYNVAATQFKKDRPLCEARLHGCQGVTHHIHDVLSKEDSIIMGFKKIE